ncbi:hypothetical protein ISN76_20280 [Dyella halodurans]|uniref:Uncharacterized protein n=1 Tax=Dyella halodurans TaxID=1920171 RepID=A0ABV9C742_9GAMM|nr:hypothetical protein [Dyella halodurans]
MSLEMAAKKARWPTTNVVGYGAMAIAAMTLILATSTLGDALASNGVIQAFVSAIGSVVPAVDAIASQTAYPAIARLMLASQWLFFPIYLGCMVIGQPPWKPLHWKEGISKGARRKAFIFSVILFVAFSVYAYGDFQHGPLSILGGTLFSPDVSVWWLRLPFAGRLGLSISAFLMPLMESAIYWLLLLLTGTAIAWTIGLGRKRANHRAAE